MRRQEGKRYVEHYVSEGERNHGFPKRDPGQARRDREKIVRGRDDAAVGEADQHESARVVGREPTNPLEPRAHFLRKNRAALIADKVRGRIAERHADSRKASEEDRIEPASGKRDEDNMVGNDVEGRESAEYCRDEDEDIGILNAEELNNFLRRIRNREKNRESNKKYERHDAGKIFEEPSMRCGKHVSAAMGAELRGS